MFSANIVLLWHWWYGMKGSRTAIFWDNRFLNHNTGFHPEKKDRIISILERLETTGYFKNCIQPKPEPAPIETIALVHDIKYIQELQMLCEQGKSGYMDPDTPFSQGTFEAAQLAAGAAIQLADMVWSGQVENGIALVRPPGHHALYSHAMGFCFFNNIAIAAKYLESKGASRIFIIDWDVHHGNGTEACFYENGKVYFSSIHQYPYYPGTGSSEDRGRGEGLGKNLNCPLPRGSGESAYKKVFYEKIFPELDEFQPEIILISAGFDAHKEDPLGGMELTTNSFENFTWWIKEKAKEHCKGKIVSLLEGGYDLTALADSVEAHVSVLAESGS